MTVVTGDWLENEATQQVMALLVDAGQRAYFVGGCVRNALMDVPVADVDIATDARPEQVMTLAKNAGIRVIPTGIDHGTVTVVAGEIPHEITTFRNDVETDGRRAVVVYSDSLEEDARRRDFTMNALYADRDGTLIDPLCGLPDLQSRRVRFIEDAGERIREDYLRTLRFFRFHAWYGDPGGGLDAEALAAISAHLDGLEMLSKERVGSEIKKLLSAPDPAPAVAAMESTGVLSRVLPGATGKYLAPLIHLEGGHAPDPIRRLVVLGGLGLKDALRLSRDEARRVTVLRELVSNGGDLRADGYRHGAQAAIDAMLLRCAMMGQPLLDNYQQRAADGAAMVFPIKAADLMPGLKGVALGKRMKELEVNWIASDFQMTRDQLLDRH